MRLPKREEDQERDFAESDRLIFFRILTEEYSKHLPGNGERIRQADSSTGVVREPHEGREAAVRDWSALGTASDSLVLICEETERKNLLVCLTEAEEMLLVEWKG